MDWLKNFGKKIKNNKSNIQPVENFNELQSELDDQEMEKLLDSFMRTCWPTNYGDHTLGVDTESLKNLKGPYFEKAKTAILNSLEKSLHVNSIIAATAIELAEAIPSMTKWIKKIRSLEDKSQFDVSYSKLAHSLYNFTKDQIYLTDLAEAVRISGFSDISGSQAIYSLWKVPLTVEAFSAVWEKLKRGEAIKESSSWRENCEDFLRDKLDDTVGQAFLKTLPETEQKEIRSIVATTKSQRIERNRRFEQFVVDRYDNGDLNKFGEYVKVGGSPVPGLALRCILEGHTKEVNSTSWSPDGSLLASAGSDNLVVIWDVKKGEFISLIDGGAIDRSGLADGYDADYRISHVGWSTDGKWIAFGSENKNISIWNVKKEAFLVPPKRTASAVRNLAWAPGQNFLLYSFDDNTVWIRDILSGEVRQIFQGYSGSFDALAWSSDAAFIAAGCWDRNKHSRVKRIIEEDKAEILLWVSASVVKVLKSSK